MSNKYCKVAFVSVILFISSCNGQSIIDKACLENFKAAKALAYAKSTSQSALDSAMNLANRSLRCDSIRVAVVDFKITLLVSMKKYSDGVKLIDSLSESDFAFGYKKKFMLRGLQALDLISKGDTINLNQIYIEMADDIESYIKNKNNIDNKEFIEVYTDLFAIKEKYLDSTQINTDAESLKMKYPDKKAFFEFFKN